jgi:hypothetical protein
MMWRVCPTVVVVMAIAVTVCSCSSPSPYVRQPPQSASSPVASQTLQASPAVATPTAAMALPAPAGDVSAACASAFAGYEKIYDTYQGPVPELRATLTECKSLAEWRAGMLATTLVNKVFATPDGDPLVKAEIQINCPLFQDYKSFPVCSEAIALGILW